MRRKAEMLPWVVLTAGAWLALGAAALHAQGDAPSLPEQPLPPPIDMEDPTWLPEGPLPVDPVATPTLPDSGTSPLPPDAPQAPVPGAEGTYQRTWTTPHGQHTLQWERTAGEDGYTWYRGHTWTNPDGTTLRQHTHSVTGTDPYNFQREKTIMLRDGRTVEHSHTQSWDGTTLQRERTFSGPNGQAHQFQQSWTVSADGSVPSDLPLAPPHDPALPPSELPVPSPEPDLPPADLPLPAPPASDVTADTFDVNIPSPPSVESDGTWLQKLNPFAKSRASGVFKPSRTRPKISRPSGFTLGASARGTWGADTRGLARRHAAQAEMNTHRQQVQQHLQQSERHGRVPRPSSPRPHLPVR